MVDNELQLSKRWVEGVRRRESGTPGTHIAFPSHADDGPMSRKCFSVCFTWSGEYLLCLWVETEH